MTDSNDMNRTVELRLMKIAPQADCLNGTLSNAEMITITGEEGKIYRQFDEIIGCRCIDVAERRIGGKWFDIICDDEFLCRDDMPIPTAMTVKDGQVVDCLMGNILVSNWDPETGATLSLTDADADLVKAHIHRIQYVFNGEPIDGNVLMMDVIEDAVY